jgi:hypothetical protein
MLQKEFVPFELAQKLRNLDFNEPCLFVYRIGSLFLPMGYDFLDNLKQDLKNCRNTRLVTVLSAPTYSQAFRWFREEHKLHPIISNDYKDGLYQLYVQDWICEEDNEIKRFSYDDAQYVALSKLIEIVEERQKQPKPVPVEKTLHTLSIYATINEKLQESGYEPITFERAVELGLNEKTQESDVESFVEYFYTKEDQEMNNKDEILPC